MKMLFTNTVPVGLSVHARGQLAWLKSQGHDVVAVTSPGTGLDDLVSREGVRTIPVPMARDIDAPRDIIALIRWVRLLLSERPDSIVYGSPKASLLASISAWMTRVPHRVYIVHGARFEGERGLKRAALLATEWLTCRLSKVVIPVSPSVQRVIEACGVVPEGSSTVVGAGSCNGVDLERFSPPRPAATAHLRERHGIGAQALVVGFVGRLTSEKGADQLARVMALVEDTLPSSSELVLLVAGWAEDLDGQQLGTSLRHTSVRYLGYTRSVQEVYWMSDVMVLPTKREGLPTSVLEASACAVPTVAFRVTGTVDVIEDSRTGFLVSVGDLNDMAARVSQLLTNPERRFQMGNAARDEVARRFRQDDLWPLLASAYTGQTLQPRDRHCDIDRDATSGAGHG